MELLSSLKLLARYNEDLFINLLFVLYCWFFGVGSGILGGNFGDYYLLFYIVELVDTLFPILYDYCFCEWFSITSSNFFLYLGDGYINFGITFFSSTSW